MYPKHYLAVLLIFLLISCTGPLNNEEEGESIKVYTVKNGSVLESGSPLPVTLVYDESKEDFDYLKITLYDDSGTVLASNRIEKSAVGNNRKREIEIPEALVSGIYHIRFELVKQDKVIFTSITDFFSDNGNFSLKNVQSYPPNPAPEEKVLLIADFESPEGRDPYFRWAIGGKTVSEGYHSKGGSRYNWKTPSTEGAYPVTVELFPSAPSGSSFNDFTSALLSEAVIFVSESNRTRSGEFSPDSSFMTLFHFRGEIADTGYGALAGIEGFSVQGEPLPDLRGGIYGYYFRINEKIRVPSLMIPFTKHGIAQPFSVRMRFIPDYSGTDPLQQAGKPFFSASSDDSTFSVSLGISGRDEYYAEIISGTERFISRASYSQPAENAIINLAFSLYPSGNSSKAVWIINGTTAGRDNLPFRLLFAGSSGSTSIGAGMYPMLIDEAGVYSRTGDGVNSVDAQAFYSFSYEKYGRALVLAEGFDYSSSRSIPADSMAEISNGLAVLDPREWVKPGDKIALPENIEVTVTGECTFILQDEHGSEVYSKAVSGNKEKFIVNGIKAGRYDILLVNRDTSRINQVDDLLVTRIMADSAN